MQQQTINRLNALSIADVASTLGIKIRKIHSKRYKCQCFMHQDHHPSMSLWTDSNTWHCFVCQKGGGPIDLVSEYKNLPFAETIQWMSQQWGIHDSAANEKTSRQYGFKINKKYKSQVSEQMETTDPLSPDNNDGLNFSHVERSEGTDNDFCRALEQTGILTRQQTAHAAVRYHLGCTKDGGVIFWQIDSRQKVHEGKVMYYMANCHRSQERTPYTISWMMKNKLKDDEGLPLLAEDWKSERCMFGEHLLSVDTISPVAVVESEKTAVVCSELFPEYLWLATGGCSCLSVHGLSVLVGRRVVIFPDTDASGDTYKQWCAIAEQASKRFKQPFFVSDILERNATEEEKRKKIDICDLVNERK